MRCGAGAEGGEGSSCSGAEDGERKTAAMMHVVTEDTPPDMLAGAMTLSVSLPDGRDVNMSVERSTPMMDLLVQVTTAYKLRPSDHIIQAIDMASQHYDRVLPYKPNTPIGALDTQCIRVLPKGRSLPAPRQVLSPGHQPFESTFRLQVHLPRNQFCVIRVGKHCLLEDIMKKVCEEKNLDPRKYEFRHPANIDQVLDPKRTLSDYEITEITVVPRGSGRLPQTLSSNDIMALQREEERRKMQAKTGGGVLNLIFRRGKNSMGSGSISSDTRSISPTQSDDSRSVTPPAVQPTQILPSIPQEKPKAPLRKRRPAPKPPQNQQNTESKNDKMASQQNCDLTNNNQNMTNQKYENGLTISHSRNSSDSSGYHEASILSDNCNTTLPRRPKSMAITSSGDSALGMDKIDYRKSTGNLNNMALHSKSTTSLTTAGRKKKAPPPPPSLKTATSLANIATTSSLSLEPMSEPQPKSVTEPNTPVVIASDEILAEPNKPILVNKPDSSMCPTPNNSARASIASLNNSSNLQETLLIKSETSSENIQTSHNSSNVIFAPNKKEITKTQMQETDTVTRKTEEIMKNHPKPLEIDTNQSEELEIDWQYQLPSPPQEFRDMSPTNFTDVTNYDTTTYTVTADSLVAPPPIFDSQANKHNDKSEIETVSEIGSVQSSILASRYISVETLEKRKSLVLERELSSLKHVPNQPEVNNNTEEIKRPNLTSEIQTEIRNRNNKNNTLSRSNSQPSHKLLHSDSTLPNFKITTYQNEKPKSKINIFEDETIRSNTTLDKRNSLADMNVYYQNYKNDTFLADKRNSLDFSTDNLRKISKNFDGIVFKKPLPPNENRGISQNGECSQNGDHQTTSSVLRSESFSQQNGWSRSSPVKRSKSQVSLERYNKMEDSKIKNGIGMEKSNSMWNVSGLQSLEVMRMILPKLENSPPSTPSTFKPKAEQQSKEFKSPEKQVIPQQPQAIPKTSPITSVEKEIVEKTQPTLQPQSPPKRQIEKTQSAISEIQKKELEDTKMNQNQDTTAKDAQQSSKVYQYRGPPSINLGTWSERPKSQIQLKEDKDYKISNISAMKARFSSQTSLNTSEPIAKINTSNVSSVNIRVNSGEKLNIKVNNNSQEEKSNSSKIINNQPGNVIIKIGSLNTSSEPTDNKPVAPNSSRNFEVTWRKPLGNINGVGKPRPRSIAFDSCCPDISRVPIVRSVELKKPFKDVQSNNKSVTQISTDDLGKTTEVQSNTLGNRFSSVYVSSENINHSFKNDQIYSKTVSRVNSFAYIRPTNNTAPVVRGFRVDQHSNEVISNKTNNWNPPDANNRTNNASWSGNHYNTLPSKPSQINQQFSQHNLKKTNNLSNLQRFNNTNNFVNSSENVVLRTSGALHQSPNVRNSTGSFNTVGLPNGTISSNKLVPVPPAPPVLPPTTPKITSVTKKINIPRQMNIDVDPRDQLLSAIRNFGGKTGLKPIK